VGASRTRLTFGMTARSFSMRGPSAPTLLLFVGFRVLLDGHWCIASAIEDQTNVCSAIALRSRHGYEMALWISICDLIFSEPLDNGNAKITPKCVSVVSQVRMTVIICRYSGCIFWMSICVFVCFDQETSLRFGGRPRWAAPQRHLTRHILGACRTLSSFLHAPKDIWTLRCAASVACSCSATYLPHSTFKATLNISLYLSLQHTSAHP
jgi:hypothetical protein